MMNNNKILTVSYGTFSCTLEGFDDSFGTMKAIAEYFRDLASDDRYFGAEPPQPDAEMLARIAQKEVSRRVEAREHEGRIVLSAHDDAASAQPQPAAVTAPADAAAAVAPAAVAAAAVAAPEVSAPQESAAAPQAVEPTAAPTTTQVTVQDEVALQADPEIEAPTAQDEPQAEAVADPAPVAEDVHVIADEATEDAAEAFFANSTPDTPVEEDTAENVDTFELMSEDAATSPDSIAAKLERIRAVVSQNDAIEDADANFDEVEEPAVASDDAFVSDFMASDLEAEISAEETPLEFDEAALPEADLEEDVAEVDTVEEISVDVEDAPEMDAVGEETLGPNSLLAETAADIEDAFDADDAIANEDQSEADTSFDDDLAEALSRFDAIANEQAPEPEATTEPAAPVIDLSAFEVTDDEEADALVALDDDEDDGDDDVDNLFGGADISEDDDTDLTAEDTTTPADDDNAFDGQTRARVMKVNTADLETALSEGEKDGSASTLSDEEEEDLRRELASVLGGADDDAPAQATETADEEDAHAALASLPAIDEGQGEDVSRLMAEAETQMEEPESANRRKAFAHLRAAVAAKKADWAMGKKDKSEDSDEAYRSDLAEAVKPRRPVANSARTERPSADARPAPLKLVAEQRIDRPKPSTPVTPRRVASVDDASIPDAAGETFAAFADEMGATKLPELLEAAAAYMSFVEGREQFSRPQLMTKVRQVENEEFSREDSLRSFGQLLRAGKIQKIKGGRFTASEDIGFKPDERAAG